MVSESQRRLLAAAGVCPVGLAWLVLPFMPCMLVVRCVPVAVAAADQPPAAAASEAEAAPPARSPAAMLRIACFNAENLAARIRGSPASVSSRPAAGTSNAWRR